MRITHPIAPYQGYQPEDVFFVSDERLMQLGTGYIQAFDQPSLYPERPRHLFINIEAQPQARNMLLGALLARAQQIRALHPQVPARLYASVPVEQTDMIRFYEENGLRMDDGEDLYSLPLQPGSQRAPLGMQYASVALQTPQLQMAFLDRINYSRIAAFDLNLLDMWQQQPHFMALGFYINALPVCEAVFTGAGTSATLLHVYTLSDYRRQHCATQLIGAASEILAAQGVERLYTHVFHRNEPQMKMMEKMQGQFIRTVTAMPGLDL